MTQPKSIHHRPAGRVGLWLIRGFPRLSHCVVELFRIKAGVVERVAATSVRQREFRCHPNILLRDYRCATPRGVRDGRACHDQIGPHPVDVESRAQRRDAP